MKLKLRLFFLGAAVLFCSPLFAQKLTGTVTGSGKPLQGSSVLASPSGKGTSTGDDGKYSLILKPGSYQITFSAIGFEKKTVTVTLAADESKVLDMDLVSASESLREVIVVGNRGG